MYGLEITLRYKNQKKFYTNYGAVASVFVYIVAIRIFASLVSDVLNRDPNLITSQIANEIETF